MYVRVRVYAGCKKESVRKLEDSHFEIHVKEPAQQNLANRRVQEKLAKAYRVSVKAVRIVSGHHSPSKLFDVITK